MASTWTVMEAVMVDVWLPAGRSWSSGRVAAVAGVTWVCRVKESVESLFVGVSVCGGCGAQMGVRGGV